MSEKTTQTSGTSQKKTTTKRATAATAKKAANVSQPAVPEIQAEPTVAKPAKPTHLDDYVRIAVRSNQYGGLVFVNSRTKEKTNWSYIDDVQDLTVADIRDMRANNRRFFEEPWVCIEGIKTPGYEDVTKDELLDMLGLSRYYSKSTRPERLSDVLEWDIDEIRAQVPKMSASTKENLIVALTDALRHGTMNALDRVRVWEEELQCTLLI